MAIRPSVPLAVVLALGLMPPAGASNPPRPASDDEARIVHALNRLAFGPRPGDVERVQRIGLELWIQKQLQPEAIPDRGLAARLASLRTISLDSAEVMRGYELPREARREIQKRRAELEDGSERDLRRARLEIRSKYGAQMEGPPRQVTEELQAAKVIRAVHGERQLDELLVDFWMNHFNVFAGKGPVRFLTGEYEREVVRPRAWGKFEDLLRATGESPAMLFYLDNWLSADPNARSRPEARVFGERRGGFGRRGGAGGFGGFGGGLGRGARRPEGMDRAVRQQQPGRRNGLNENYARELLELHTLGVDGGYTQKDVTEVARAFTGWTIRGLFQGRPEFAFDERVHDRGDKLVLGQKLEAGGKDEGDRILHTLATHASTARFISTKLARRFVADEPPQALVERAAATFRRTGGDIRAVVTAIVTSPEFFAPEARQAKVKTPLDFVASAARAAGATVTDASELARRIGEMGMPLYMQQPPTGYKDTADAWVSTSGLLARLNFALDLAGGRVRGVAIDPATVAAAGGGSGAQGAIAARLVPQGLTAATRATIAREGDTLEPTRIAGLILGSPEFQRR